MLLTAKGQKIMAAMKSEYGDKKGDGVFYASRNADRTHGIDHESSNKAKELAHYLAKRRR